MFNNAKMEEYDLADPRIFIPICVSMIMSQMTISPHLTLNPSTALHSPPCTALE